MTRTHNKRPRSGRKNHPKTLAAIAEANLTDEERNLRFRAKLLAAAEEQRCYAKEKQEKSWYWGDTGYCEESAVDYVCKLIEQVPLEQSHELYYAEMDHAFGEKIAYYRQSDAADPDGYALGTLYAIWRGAES